MEAVEVGQRYIVRPEFSAVESSSFGRGAKKAKQLVGKAIHVNQRHRHVTLEFDVAMGKIRETIAISDLGKRVQWARSVPGRLQAGHRGLFCATGSRRQKRAFL